MSTVPSYKELRRQYETSIARAKLEFAESGDNDKVWPGINHRQDERDEAIFAKLNEIEPTDMGEVRELLKIVAMFMQEQNQIGMTSEEIETALALVRTADGGLGNVEQAERKAKWEADDKARGIGRKPDPVKPVEKRDIEIDLEKAVRLIECASCAAEYVKVSPGCLGIVAALTEASNALCDVMEKLGIQEAG